MPDTQKGNRVLPCLLLAAAAVMLFTALGGADLFNPDEPREAELAREMLDSGDLLVPHLNGEPFLEKPPLFYWLVVPVLRLAGGPGEAAARAVPAACGLLCVLLTWWMARALIGGPAALLAGAVLLTAFEFFWISRRCMIDMPLTLAVLLTCAALHRAIEAVGRERLGWLGLGCAACAAALLLKGAVGAGIPALAAVAWLAARRDLPGLLRRGIVPMGVLALVPITLWVTRLGARLGTVAVREFVVVNNVLRFTGGAARGHDNPFWYYLPTLLTDFFPWSIVLPFAIVAALRAPARKSPHVRDLLLWLLVPLVVLSIASTKRGLYLLPVYPPGAMLVAWWLAGDWTAADGGAPRRSRRAACWILFGFIVVLSVVILVALRLVRSGAWAGPIVAAIALALPASLAWQAARADEGRRFGLAVAWCAGLLELIVAVAIVPAIVNGGTSARETGTEIRRLAEAGDRVALYGIKEGTVGELLFYAGRTLPSLRRPEDLERHLAQDATGTGPRALVVMRASVFEEAARVLPFALVEARRWRVRSGPWEAGGPNDFVLAVRGP